MRSLLVPCAHDAECDVTSPGYASSGMDFEDVAVFDDVFLADLLSVV